MIKTYRMKSLQRNNGLSISFLILFTGALIGQIFFGFRIYHSHTFCLLEAIGSPQSKPVDALNMQTGEK